MYIVTTGKERAKVRALNPFLAFKLSGHKQDDETLTEIQGGEGTFICSVITEGRYGRTVKVLKIA